MRYEGRKVFEINVCKKKFLSCMCCKEHDDCYDRVKDSGICYFSFDVYIDVYRRVGCSGCGME